MTQDHQEHERWAQALERSPNYRILRRLVPRLHYEDVAPGTPLMKGVVLDTETTGLNSQQDRVIELGMLLFEFDPVSGVVHRVLEVFDELEDPGFPIPPEVTAIHHITDDMVQGQRIDDARVERFLRDVQVVVAHNAAFDRPFVESRWPVFEQLAWACSVKDVPWKEEGFGSAKLEYLLQTQGFFYEAHRAETDCHALLELLSRRLPQRQQPVLLSILETLNQAQFKLYALGSPFETKDLLKQRGYRWSPELRCWTRLLSTQEQLQEETQWLRRRVYGERKAAVEIESLGGTIRYSQRGGQRETRVI
jgi:DNA polymerase-3 subunit epsilon